MRSTRKLKKSRKMTHFENFQNFNFHCEVFTQTVQNSYSGTTTSSYTFKNTLPTDHIEVITLITQPWTLAFQWHGRLGWCFWRCRSSLWCQSNCFEQFGWKLSSENWKSESFQNVSFFLKFSIFECCASSRPKSRIVIIIISNHAQTLNASLLNKV